MIQLNDELKRVAAHAADLNHQLVMRNADAFGKLHTPTWLHSQQRPTALHGPTSAGAHSNDIQVGIVAARAKARLVTIHIGDLSAETSNGSPVGGHQHVVVQVNRWKEGKT